MKRIILLCCLACCSFLAQAQTRNVQGTIIDADKRDTLVGVTVVVKGTTQGTVTDVNGHFSIAVPDTGTTILRLAYTGYKETDVRVGAESVYTFRLPSQGNMNEVVVIGYQAVRRRDLTGSVSSVNAKQLKDVPVNSAAEALTGRLAGVQVTGTEGTPNADVLVRVRGGGSITQDNSPLYVIDGIQVENGLATLSPQDIESVDVLKDASATAIYGARGANGVVIITTKRGKAGKTKISYNGFVGIRQVAKTLKTMSPEEFVKYQYERSRGNAQDSASFAKSYGSSWDTLAAYGNVPAVDWQDEMFGRSALFTTHNLGMNGGNASTQYNASLTSNKEEGVMRNSGFDRKLFSLTLDHKVNNRLSVAINTRYNNTVVNGAGTSNPGSSSLNNLRQSVRYRPFLTSDAGLEDYDAEYADATNSNSLSLVNPILLNQAQYRKTRSVLYNLSGSATYRFTDWLSFKTSVGYDYTTSRRQTFDDTITYVSRQTGGRQPVATVGNYTRATLNNSNVLSYTNIKSEKPFAKKNAISALIGQEIYQNNYTGNFAEYHNLPLGMDGERALSNLGQGTPFLTNSPASADSADHLLSFFGRINYTYDDRFLLSASLRRDGSSKFGEDYRWGNFPSAAVAYRISNERFMQSLKSTLSELKIRVSYGQAGNNRIGNNQFETQFLSNNYYYLNNTAQSTYVPAGLAYTALKWETTTSRNLGVDASFYNGRITFTGDVYYNTTKDLLIAAPIPQTSGYTTQLMNIGRTSNRGVEFQVTAIPVQTKKVNWTVNYNMSFNRNKIDKITDRQSSYLVSSGWAGANNPADYIVQEGRSVGTMWGLVNDGYYTTDDFNYDPGTKVYTLKSGVANGSSITSTIPMPGGIKFKDINGDGVINDKDRTIIGDATPKFFGGLNQQFSYGNFDLSIYFNFQYGNKVYNDNKLEFTSAYTTDANMLDVVNGRWRTIDAQGNVIQKVATVGGQQVVVGEAPDVLNSVNANASMWIPMTSNSAFYPQSYAVEDASFIRLNNITLGYTLPKSLVKRARIESLRFYVTGNNLHVWTKYSGYDPEVSTRRGTPTTPGVDYSAYPRSRSYVFGLNLNF